MPRRGFFLSQNAANAVVGASIALAFVGGLCCARAHAFQTSDEWLHEGVWHSGQVNVHTACEATSTDESIVAPMAK